jgi:hypothetical protein
MAFPEDPLGTTTELGIDGVFTNVTPHTLTRDIITHSRGQRAEGQAVDPASCSLTLKSPNGLYSPRNPRSPYFEKIGLNTPTRVSVFTGNRYLWLPDSAGNGASTPDAAVLDITGDIDIRIDLTLDPWNGAANLRELAGKYGVTGNQRSWALFVWTDGRLVWRSSPDGTNVIQYLSPVPIVVPASGRLAVRATLDVDNGAGGHTLTWYTAPTIAGPWTMLGTPDIHAGTTSIFSSTAPLMVGDVTDLGFERPTGRAHAFELRSGIGGTVVANPDFSTPAEGAASFVDGAGRTWTPSGSAAITNRQIRFVGEFSDWPAEWSGRGDLITVNGEAVGILERMNQGKKVLASTLRRRIPSYNPVAYWPMEEGADATSIYSPIAGVKSFKPTAFNQAADDTLPGSSPLPVLEVGASFVAPVPAAPAGTWQVELVYNLDTMPVAKTTLFEVRTTGTARRVLASVATNQVWIEGLDADGSSVFSQTSTGPAFTGAWNRLQIKAVQSGSNVQYVLRWITIGGGGLSTGTTIAAAPGSVLDVRSSFGTGLDGMRFGHLAVFTTESDTPFSSADQAFNGETAAARMTRLCTEEGVPFRLADPAAETAQLGPQRPGTLLKLLQDCADTDGGIFGEERDRIGLRYRPRTTLYNQTPTLTLAYGDRGVARPLRPVEPDSVRNDITVNRVAGGSGRAVLEEGRLSVQDPPDGVGLYDEDIDLNLYSDDQAEPAAYWRLHLGTWDEARYPVVTVKLHKAPQLIDTVLGITEGDMLRITDLPDFLPPGPVDLLVQGYTERLGTYTWEVEFTCVPAGPWRVGVVDNAANPARADTDGSELDTAATATATTLTVRTTDGEPWTTNITDLPFDIRVGGEVMQVEPAGTVLTVNPSFETDTSGWTATSATLTRSSAVRRVGSWSALLTTGAGSNPRAADALRAVTAGSTYTALGWLYAPVALSQPVGVNVNWYNASQTYLSTSSNTATLTPGTWTPFNAQFTAPVGAAYASILFTVTNSPGAGYLLYADNVKLISGGTGIKPGLKDDFSRSVSPTVTDSFTRTTTGGWGSATTGQAWSTSGGSASDYATNGTKGTASVGVVNSSRFTALDTVSLADLDMQADMTVPVVATGASISTGLRLRSADTSNYYYIEAVWGTAGTVSVQLVSRVAAVSTTIAGPVSKGTYAAGDTWTVRARVVGSVLQAKLWKTSGTEPDLWDVEAVTTSLPSAAPIGTRSLLSTGNTNTLPVVVSWDNVRVTAVTQGWGTSSSGDAWTTSGGNASEYFVDTIKGEGYIELTSVNSSRRLVTGPSWTDTDLLAAFTVPVVAATDSIDPGIMSRYADSGTYYLGTLHFHNDSTVDVRIRENVAGVFTTLSISNLLPGTYSAGSTYWLRFRTQGSNLYARGWAYGTTEPTIWHASTTDTSITAAGRVGIRANLQVNNTNSLPVTMRVGSFTVDSPQLFTVARSVNGIVKAQAAGAVVSLANPAFVAL